MWEGFHKNWMMQAPKLPWPLLFAESLALNLLSRQEDKTDLHGAARRSRRKLHQQGQTIRVQGSPGAQVGPAS